MPCCSTTSASYCSPEVWDVSWPPNAASVVGDPPGEHGSFVGHRRLSMHVSVLFACDKIDDRAAMADKRDARSIVGVVGLLGNTGLWLPGLKRQPRMLVGEMGEAGVAGERGEPGPAGISRRCESERELGSAVETRRPRSLTLGERDDGTDLRAVGVLVSTESDWCIVRV